MKKKKKSKLTTVLLFFIFLAGLSLLLYPTVSNYWNSLHQSRAIAGYVSALADLDDETYQQIWNDAVAYNTALARRSNPYVVPDEIEHLYKNLLNVGGSGVMGYIEIPRIEVELPVYHTTDEAVLQIAVGHLEWTSLPVGGASTHCVLSGHRGLPSAKLFTHLDKVEVGDVFYLYVLDETLTYEVDQILIVEPSDSGPLTIESGEDYCTLVTCTPYGVNTHRMLVRGHRIENQEEAKTIRVVSEAMLIDTIIVAPAIAAPMLFLLLLVLLFGRGGKSKRKRGNHDEFDENEMG